MNSENFFQSLFPSDLDLSNYEWITAGSYNQSFIHAKSSATTKANVKAALMAGRMNLQSVDYTRRTYIPQDNHESSDKGFTNFNLQLDRVKKSNKLLEMRFSKIKFHPETDITYTIERVTTRLLFSTLSVNSLLCLGFLYETMAIVRQILEQTAYLFYVSMHKLEIDKFPQPTKCINALSRALSGAGHLYGILSSLVHINESVVGLHLDIKDEQTIVYGTRPTFKLLGVYYYEFCMVYFNAVFDYVCQNYMSESEFIDKSTSPLLSLKTDIKQYTQPLNIVELLKVIDPPI